MLKLVIKKVLLKQLSTTRFLTLQCYMTMDGRFNGNLMQLLTHRPNHATYRTLLLQQSCDL